MTTLTKTDYSKVWAEALAAGEAAAAKVIPTPMVVYETAGLSDAPKPDGKQWYVPSGLCGFAWVTIKPATSGFAKWLKATTRTYKGTYGGICIFAHPECAQGQLSQSIEIKEAWARAVAKVLKDYGISAYAESRLD